MIAVRRLAAGAVAVFAACSPAGCSGSSSRPPHARFATPAARLTIVALTDDLIHFELAGGETAADTGGATLRTTPMVARDDDSYPGPARFTNDGHGHLATATLALDVDAATLCVTATDTRDAAERHTLTTLCPEALTDGATRLTLAPRALTHAYGLGEHFGPAGVANGDLVGRVLAPGVENGNAMTKYQGGFTGNAHFPVLYALGGGGERMALFLDHSRAQTWDLSASPWRVDTSGEVVRGYFIGGSSLAAVRANYMDLVGRPPVPPRRMFGMWVSEFGYRSWDELEEKLHSLRAQGFPVDGFVLDLFWFGGVFNRPSHMGTLRWDESRFPDAAATVARLRDDDGIGLMTIEESYVDRSLPEFADLEALGELVRDATGEGPLTFNTWWGNGGLIDWTSDAAGDRWHDLKRQPLAEIGVTAHWTDLGEPEEYGPNARYHGVPGVAGRSDRDVHDLMNLAWAESIARGYRRHRTGARPWILSRSGTTGIQRAGAGIWSGDIGSNLPSLAASFNAQMQLSFAGLDYFGNDIGGYHREALDGDRDELYTRWFADGVLLDVPARPHTLNLLENQPTAPDRIGDPASNLASLRLRYRLVPYLYSLAHRAHLHGEAYEPPLVMLDEHDETLAAGLADEKLLGPSLLVATTSRYGESARDVYLPRGRWADYRTHQWFESAGEWVRDVPVSRDGRIEAPVFARAGAIVPEMFVDEQTMNVFGRRKDGTSRDELVVRVYAADTGAAASEFTLYEDDGVTIDYLAGAVRTTRIEQERDGAAITVTVDAAVGDFDGAVAARDTVIELAAPELPRTGGGEPSVAVTGVSLGGTGLPRRATRTELDAAPPGWLDGGDGLLVIRAGVMDVAKPKRFEITFAAAP